MKKWINYLPTLFVVLIVLSLFFYSSQGSTRTMNYTQFKEIAEDARFGDTKVSISTSIIHVDGVLQDGDSNMQYSVIIPNSEANLEWLEDTLTENGGQITV